MGLQQHYCNHYPFYPQLFLPFGSLKNFDRNLLRAGPAASISLERSCGWSLSELSWQCGDPVGDISVEVTKMSSEPFENRLESEKDELLLAGQERSSGWICTSTMARPRGSHFQIVINHWDQPAWQGYLPLHLTLWETITTLIVSIDVFWVNMEFLNCNRSKS